MNGPVTQAAVASPFGPIRLIEEDGALVGIRWPVDGSPPATALLRKAAEQLAAYFAGELTVFDLPVRFTGTAFEQAVQREIAAIPFGETRTYGDLAKRLDAMPQPVGQACGSNRLPLVVPCHRVLGASGLGGFSAAGGVEDKVWLLRHEGAAGLLL